MPVTGKICAFYGCYNYGNQPENNRSFFRFPKDKERCNKWVHVSKRSDLDKVFKEGGSEILNKSYSVCSDHFLPNDYNNPNQKSQGLKKNVVPSACLPNSRPSHNSGLNMDQSNLPKRRRSPKKRQRSPSQPTQVEERLDHQLNNVSDDARIPKRKKVDTEAELKLLKQQLRNSQKTVSRYKRMVCDLRQQKVVLQKEKATSTAELIDASCKKGFNSDFFKSQLSLSRRSKKGRRYTNYDKSFALALHYCSPKSYRFLRKHFCLPTVRSLRRWLENLDVAPGFNENVLSMLKVKAQLLEPSDRVVSIVIDEMSLKEYVSYDARSDMFEGFCNESKSTRPRPKSKCKSTSLPSKNIGPSPSVTVTSKGDSTLPHSQIQDNKTNLPERANQGVVFMLRGLKKNFKQVIGYFLSKDAMPARNLKDMLLLAINKIKSAGFIPKVVVCDQGSNNVQLRKLLDVTIEKPFIDLENDRVYFFYDAPHLLKSVRNNLKKYDFELDGRLISWKVIVDFYEKDKGIHPRLAPKVKEMHLSLPPFSPMRVCLATQILSHSVSTGISTHVALGSMASSSIPTAKFIKDMDSLFDTFNSSQLRNAKQLLRGVKETSKHWEFLDNMLLKLKRLKVLNKFKNTPPCIKGWISNIIALQSLVPDLVNNNGFVYLLTRRLTQDCIENLFSILRYRGGNNTTPDASKFRSSIKATMANSLLVPPQDSNCEMDFDTFLLKKEDLEKSDFKLKIPAKVTDLCTPCDESQLQNTLDLAEINALHYVTGWACSKLPHKECSRKVCSLENSYDLNQIHILLKKYDCNSKLLYPNQYIMPLSLAVTNSIKSNYFYSLLRTSHTGVKTKLKESIIIPEDCPLCATCVAIFIDKLFNVNINCFVKNQNNCILINKGKKNKKAAKVMHK